MSPRGHPEPRTVVSLPSHDARLNLYVQTESDAPDFVNGLLWTLFENIQEEIIEAEEDPEEAKEIFEGLIR